MLSSLLLPAIRSRLVLGSFLTVWNVVIGERLVPGTLPLPAGKSRLVLGSFPAKGQLLLPRRPVVRLAACLRLCESLSSLKKQIVMILDDVTHPLLLLLFLI